jgi:hypothetical protein
MGLGCKHACDASSELVYLVYMNRTHFHCNWESSVAFALCAACDFEVFSDRLLVIYFADEDLIAINPRLIYVSISGINFMHFLT